MSHRAQQIPPPFAVSPEVTRFLVVRLSALGDVLHALPAVTALRRQYPNAYIGWAIEERWAELLCARNVSRCGERSPGRPLVDRVHTVDTHSWRRALFSDATWKGVRGSVQEITAAKYDAAIDFQGAIRSALLARLSGAPVIYGFAQPRENVASMFYTRQVQVTGRHVIEQNLVLASAPSKTALRMTPGEVPRDPSAENQVKAKLRDLAFESYVVLNPGAGWGAKQWPVDRYGQVARMLARRTGLRSLINFGPGEQDLARTTEASSEGTAKAITTSISELIALIRHARLVIGGDTGPVHLAALLGIPVVAIFGPTDPARNGPLGTTSIVLRDQTSETSHKRTRHPEAGLLEITTAEVVSAAIKLLEEGRV
jgi:heptosyltransferase-1